MVALKHELGNQLMQQLILNLVLHNKYCGCHSKYSNWISPSDFVLIRDDLPTVPNKRGVEVEDDVNEENNVDHRVENYHADGAEVHRTPGRYEPDHTQSIQLFRIM